MSKSMNLVVAFAVGLLPIATLAMARNSPPIAEIVIRGGTIYDGSSTYPMIGDVGISGDKIVFVGPSKQNPFRAKRVIEARGMIVAPGFIDPHTHADVHLTASDATQRLNLPWLMQGVTTIFNGNDGFGQPGDKVDIAGLFSGIQDKGFGTNVAAYVGFGAVRRGVIGDADRAPTLDELEKMKALVAKGMCEGAMGLSTGLFYVPQYFAKTGEVIALASEAAKRGGVYDTHQRTESNYPLMIAATNETLEIGRSAGMPVHFAHMKMQGVDNIGKATEIIAIIEKARVEGLNVSADQYPWEASTTTLEAILLPAWSRDGGRAAMLKRFDDPVTLDRIQADMRENLRRRGGAGALMMSEKGQAWSGKRLAGLAQEWNVEPVEAAVRVFRAKDGNSAISFSIGESDIRLFMQRPWIMTGSDGGPGHPRMYATYPQKYAKYVLQERTITLAEFINSSTSRTADWFKLDRRGHLRSGHYADVVVFDPNRYRPKADYSHPDVLAEGVKTLIVNGAIAIDAGRPTGIAAGRGIKHTPTAGTCP